MDSNHEDVPGVATSIPAAQMILAEAAPKRASAESLPSQKVMIEAFLSRDRSFDGVFITAVRTTGIFCRPTCPARKPKPANVTFFRRAREAMVAGYRPCKRCRPMEAAGAVPEWLAPLLEAVESDVSRRWRDRDLRALEMSPERVRRWFLRHHGMTFHAYQRCLRLGRAMGRIRSGSDVTGSAFDCGYESLSGFGEAFKGLFGGPPTQSKDLETLVVTRVATPLGAMVAVAGDALLLLEFADRRMLETQISRLRKLTGAQIVPGSNSVIDQLGRELTAYFRGEVTGFSVPIESPGTDFQQTVWKRLREIPPGETISYGRLAADLGRPGAARAVARANGDNRIAILIPCHRVIGADGRLTGYGGGLWRKQRLLEIEQGTWKA